MLILLFDNIINYNDIHIHIDIRAHIQFHIGITILFN